MESDAGGQWGQFLVHDPMGQLRRGRTKATSAQGG